MTLETRATSRADDRSVARASRQDEAVAGVELDRRSGLADEERDRAVGAAKELLVRVVVGRVPIAGGVAPGHRFHAF